MAKYTINHICGHTSERQLYGKASDRDRTIEWLEVQDCPSCWGEAKRAEEASKPITATITLTVDVTRDEMPIIEIALTGGTIHHKDEIKTLGYYWQDIRGNVMDMLSMHRPNKAWCKYIAYHEKHSLSAAIDEIKHLVGEWRNNIGPLDIALLQSRKADKAKQDAAIAAIPKPIKPADYPTHLNGRWNGKVYGKAKYGYRVYLDNKEISITDAEAKAITDYQEAMASYKIACAAAKKEA